MLVADGMLGDEIMVELAMPNDQVQQAVHHRHVRADVALDVDVGLSRSRGFSRIDGDQFRPVRTRQPVQYPHPQDGLRFGDVVADEKERVGDVDIGVAGGIAVRAERFPQRRHVGGGTEAGIAVHVRSPDATLRQRGQGVVFFDEELP